MPRISVSVSGRYWPPRCPGGQGLGVVGLAQELVGREDLLDGLAFQVVRRQQVVHRRQFGQQLQVLFGRLLGDQQRKHQVDWFAVEGVELDRLGQQVAADAERELVVHVLELAGVDVDELAQAVERALELVGGLLLLLQPCLKPRAFGLQGRTLLLQLGALGQLQPMLAAAAGSDLDHELGTVQALAGGPLQPDGIQRHLTAGHRLGTGDADQHLFTGPRAPLGAPLAFRVLVVGDQPGDSIPASERMDAEGWIKWADATVRLGWYIGVLATDAAPAGVNGLVYGGGAAQLWSQTASAVAVMTVSCVIAFIVVSTLLVEGAGAAILGAAELHRGTPMLTACWRGTRPVSTV